jgi:uncharacterized protein (TIGR02271 family)
MTRFTEAYDFRGRTLVDREGEKIGTVDEVYSSQEGGQPEWALVHTGLLGTKKSFVPLRGASPSGGDVHVTVDRQAVQDSPSVEADQELSEAEERRLFEHYGVPYTAAGSPTAQGVGDASTRAAGREADADYAAERGGAARGAVDRDVSGPTTDDAMTRSEEELRVGTRERETGRVRLRKYVVTEHVQQTVPVRREEVRLEREPITDANVDRAMAGPEISEEEHEVVLHEEVPVVEKRVVPKERVRLDKDTITDEQQISEAVRKEQIDVDDASRDR